MEKAKILEDYPGSWDPCTPTKTHHNQMVNGGSKYYHNNINSMGYSEVLQHSICKWTTLTNDTLLPSVVGMLDESDVTPPWLTAIEELLVEKLWLAASTVTPKVWYFWTCFDLMGYVYNSKYNYGMVTEAI